MIRTTLGCYNNRCLPRHVLLQRTKDGAFRMDATEYAFTFGTILALVLPLWMWASAEYSNNPSDWALDEAEERFRRRAKGLPVEYGENYAGMKSNGYLKNNTVEELVEARQSIEASATPLTDFINAARSRKANASD